MKTTLYPQPNRLKSLRILGLAAGLLLIAGSTSPSLAATTYSGQAFGASVEDSTGLLTLFADTGDLPAAGGNLSGSAMAVNTNDIQAATMSSSTTGVGNLARSSAVVNNLVLLPNMFGSQIEATSVAANTEANCNGTSGSSQITGLTIGGSPVTVTGEVNQMVDVPGFGTLILNEQIAGTAAGGVQSITVNAMRFVTLEPVGTVIVASAHSDIGGCTAPCQDFVTGGGFVPIDNHWGNFGFNAGFKPNSTTPSIDFNFIDHRTGMHVKATSIDVYVVGSTPTTRHMEGSADVDGATLGYIIEVTDNGEPGTSDVMTLTLSDGYSVGGTIRGGNIQLHKPCN